MFCVEPSTRCSSLRNQHHVCRRQSSPVIVPIMPPHYMMDPLGELPPPPPTNTTTANTTTTTTQTTPSSQLTYTYTTDNSNLDDPPPYPPSNYPLQTQPFLLDPFPLQEQLPSSYYSFGFDPSPLAPPSSFFDEAYRNSPSPPLTASLLPIDNVLNPIQSHHIFGFPVLDPQFPRRPHSPIVPTRSQAMPPSRPARLPNGYVDLTNSAPGDMSSSRPPKRDNPTPGPSQKRQKRHDGTAANVEDSKGGSSIDEVDLSADAAGLEQVLQKQREEAVKAQQVPEKQATTFRTINCCVCMDTPTDLTATSCGMLFKRSNAPFFPPFLQRLTLCFCLGHLFCHTCLMESLITGENRAAPGEPKRSQCPICRKIINRNKPADIIPLLLKKGLATQPRKKNAAAANALPQVI